MILKSMEIIGGLFIIYCSLAKPNFHWECLRTKNSRDIFGDTLTTIFNMSIGIFLLVHGLYF